MNDTPDKSKGNRETFPNDRGRMVTDTLKKAGAGIMETVREGAETAGRAVTNFTDDAKDKIDDWTSTATDAAKNAGETAQKFAGEAYDATKESVKNFGGEMTSFVKKYPIQTVFAAFAVGLILGRAAKT